MKVILTSDWHLREKTPISRKDSFWDDMWKKIDFVATLQKELDAIVLHAGDLFDHWKPSPRLLSYAIEHLPDKFYTVYGNHDLPQHNLDLKERSGIFTLQKAGKVNVLDCCHWNDIPSIEKTKEIDGVYFLVWHNFVYNPGVADFWEKDIGINAGRLLQKYSFADVILTGDNHKAFKLFWNERLLVNPGSLLRLTKKQVDFKPRIYVYDTLTKDVEIVYLPIDKDVWVLDALMGNDEKDDKIEAFISGLKTDFNMSIDFKANLRRFFKKNAVDEAVQNKIWQVL